MIYLLFIIPGLIVLYVIYFFVMINQAVKTSLYYKMDQIDESKIESEEFNYGALEDFPRKGRIYYPKDNGGNLTCVILFHGEIPDFINPKPVDWQMFQDYGHLMASKGFATVIFNHRSTKNLKDAGPAREDLKQLLSYLKEKNQNLPINGKDLKLWSFSGGSYVCLNWLIKEKIDSVTAYVSYYGALSGKERGESAITLIQENNDRKLPPILLVKAEKDMVRSSIKEAEQFYDMTKASHAVNLLSHPGPHGFDAKSKTPETIDIIDRTIEFIRNGKLSE